MSDVFLDCDQYWVAGEHAAARTHGVEIAKKELHHVEPGVLRRSEMHVKARILSQPLLHDWMLVHGPIISNQM